MTNLKSRATIGDDNAAQLLRSAGIKSLQSRAGKIPLKTRKMNAKSTLRAAQRKSEQDAAFAVLDAMRAASDLSFSDYEASANYFHSQNLKPLIPMVNLARLNKPLYEIWRWVNGRAWIAGSAALWCVDADADWLYGDIDIFCRSEEFYRDLVAELTELEYIGSENGEYSTKFIHSPFSRISPSKQRFKGANALSILSPVDKDWSTIESLLMGFDLSICAVAIANPRKAYAYSPKDIMWRSTNLLCVDFPLRTLKRLFKYLQRGYRLSWNSADRLVEDSRYDEVFEVLNMAASFTDHSQLKDLVEMYNTSKSWSSTFEDHEDEDDDGYHYS